MHNQSRLVVEAGTLSNVPHTYTNPIINWNQRVLCQKLKDNPCNVQPIPRADSGAGYRYTAHTMLEFSTLDAMPIMFND